MANNDIYEGYEINEQEIDKALRILKVYDPANATPERATEFLIYLRSKVKDSTAAASPEALKKSYESYCANK